MVVCVFSVKKMPKMRKNSKKARAHSGAAFSAIYFFATLSLPLPQHWTPKGEASDMKPQTRLNANLSANHG